MKGECGKCGSGTVQGLPRLRRRLMVPRAEGRREPAHLQCSWSGRGLGGDEPDDSERMSRALRHENTRREYIALGSAWHHRRITRAS